MFHWLKTFKSITNLYINLDLRTKFIQYVVNIYRADEQYINKMVKAAENGIN